LTQHELARCRRRLAMAAASQITGRTSETGIVGSGAALLPAVLQPLVDAAPYLPLDLLLTTLREQARHTCRRQQGDASGLSVKTERHLMHQSRADVTQQPGWRMAQGAGVLP